MRACRLYEARSPLRIEELARPEPGPGEVLVAVEACGICGSDVHFWQGHVPVARMPITLGHEPAGVVAEVGEGVEGWAPGSRVAVGSGLPCGRCYACLAGRESICIDLRILGVHVDGALADYVLVPSVSLIALPESVSFQHGAIATDAVATPFHAITGRAGLQAGETVAIFGIGGLGTHAVQIARFCGAAFIVAVDVDEAALQRALAQGADAVIDASQEEPPPRIRALTGGDGVDVALEFVGKPQTVEQAVRSLRRGGRAVVVGMGPEKLQLVAPNVFTWSEYRLSGSFGSSRDDIERVLTLLASGRLDLSHSVSATLPLEDANRGLEMLRTREGHPVRIVVEPKRYPV